MCFDDLHEAAGWLGAQQQAKKAGLILQKHENGKWSLSIPNPAATEIKNSLSKIDPLDWKISSYFSVTFSTIAEFKKNLSRLSAFAKQPSQAVAVYNSEREAEAYDELQDLYRLSLNHKPAEMQVFMPRYPDLSKADKEWLNTVTQSDKDLPIQSHERRDIYEAGQPIILKGNSPPGNNKPRRAFWTSNLTKSYTRGGRDYWTSDWVEFVINDRMDKWWAPLGYVYSINPGARLLPFHENTDALQIYNIYAKLEGRKTVNSYRNWDYNQGDDSVAHLFDTSFPWDRISQNWDGVYHNAYIYDGNQFMYGWDVNSCAWFNPNVLTFRGRVLIKNPAHAQQMDD